MVTEDASRTPERGARVGLLLVHGIGTQEPGAFLGEFVDGFRALFGADHVTRPRAPRRDPVESDRSVHTAALEIEGRTVLLYEVHWADLIPDDLAHGSFNADELFVLAWFPSLNKRGGLPGFEAYSTWRVRSWTLRLVPLTVLVWLGCVGIRAVPHLQQAIDSFDGPWQWARPKRGAAAQGTRTAAKALRMKGRSGRPRMPLHDLLRLDRRGWFDVLLDEYVGDVVNYLISRAALPRLRSDLTTEALALRELLKAERYPDEVERLERRLRSSAERRDRVVALAARIHARFARSAGLAVEDGCTEIQVLGHSLGSVIAYDALNGAAADAGPRSSTALVPRLTRLHTIGCPLEKIHFFWPGLALARTEQPVLVAEGPGGQVTRVGAAPDFAWNNYYSGSDLVSGKLERYQAWGRVDNRVIAGLGGLFTAHVAYKGNRPFLGALAEALGVRAEVSPGSRARRFWRGLLSFGQLLAFPGLVVLLAAAGVVVLAVVGSVAAGLLAGLGWLVVAAVQLVRPDWWTGWSTFTAFGWLVALFGGAVLVESLIGAPRWGKRVARMSIAYRWRRLAALSPGPCCGPISRSRGTPDP